MSEEVGSRKSGPRVVWNNVRWVSPSHLLYVLLGLYTVRSLLSGSFYSFAGILLTDELMTDDPAFRKMEKTLADEVMR